MKLTTLVLGLTVLSACGGSVEATQYDQTCSQDADCTAAFTGPLCGVCGGCANAAINVAAKAKYDADVRAITSSCPPRIGPAPCAAGACLQPTAVCTSGVCALQR